MPKTTNPTNAPLAVLPPEPAELGRARLNHRALAAGWAADMKARAAAGMLAERTADAYARNAGNWLDWLDTAGLDKPTPADVLAFVAMLRTRGLKAATVNAHLDAVRGLYRWAETQNLYPAIARSVRGLPVRKDEPLDALSRDAVAGLLDYADGATLAAQRDRALVHVLFSTGLRLVSLCGLSVADLDAGDAVLTYRGKGDREAARRAYLSPSAQGAVNAYLQARRQAGDTLAAAAPLFAAVGNRAGGDRLTARSVRRVVVGLMEKAGHVQRDTAGKISRPRVLSAHSLRRSAITAAYDAKGLDAAQTLAGHADPKTTLRAYARVQKARVLSELAGVLDLGRRAA